MPKSQVATSISESRQPAWLSGTGLIVSLIAITTAFLPFAFNTSPWDAIRLHVPGNQGNWWHALVAAPFFLAFPMVWMRVSALFSAKPPSSLERRTIWALVGLSALGTILVELPFLLHLAGTSDWQRLAVILLGLGTVVASAIALFPRRRQIPATRACVLGLNTAYLANAALCLVVYSSATGPMRSRTGWIITFVIVWPMALEVLWILGSNFRTKAS